MKKRILSLICAMALTSSLAAGASAASDKEKTMSIPVTLSVVHTAQSIDVTLPAALPVSVVDGKAYSADNLAIRNNSKSTSVRITNISVTNGEYRVASYTSFPSSQKSVIALRINGCETTAAGSMKINESAFPAVAAGASMPIRYDAKVSESGDVSGIRAANVVFTLRAG